MQSLARRIPQPLGHQYSALSKFRTSIQTHAACPVTRPLHADGGADDTKLAPVYGAMCGLLHFDASQQGLQGNLIPEDPVKRLDCDLQAAAAVIVHIMNPESFITLSPKFLRGSRVVKPLRPKRFGRMFLLKEGH